jgi:hypothetical protein
LTNILGIATAAGGTIGSLRKLYLTASLKAPIAASV